MGTWVVDLLQPGEDIGDSRGGPFSPRPGQRTGIGIGSDERDAQGERLAIGDEDEASVSGRVGDGANDKTTPEEWVGRIGHFDLAGLRVLEVGIKARLLLTGSTMRGWKPMSPAIGLSCTSGCAVATWKKASGMRPRKEHLRAGSSRPSS